jgi:hypothetical protein
MADVSDVSRFLQLSGLISETGVSMSARFAGSRMAGERRRRRLAADMSENAPSSKQDQQTPLSIEGPKARPEFSRANSNRLPLNRLISSRLWKHGLFAVFGLLIGLGILAGAANVTKIREISGPAVGDMFDLSTNRLPTIFNSVCLFLSGQLALLIWWVRSRSRQDFSGKYRIWAWAATFAFSFSLMVMMGLHHVWAETLMWQWEFDFSQQETLLWLAPVIGCASALLWEIKAEMRDCRLSLTIFWMAILFWAAFAGLALAVIPEWNLMSQNLAVTGCSMLGYFTLLVAMLLHARHVIYVSSEPPQSARNSWSSIIRNLASRVLRLPFRKNRTLIATLDTPVPTEEESLLEKTDSPVMKTEPKSVSSEDVAPAPTPAKKKRPAARKPVEVSQQPTAEIEEKSDETEESARVKYRVDAPVEKSAQLKGLSKRERRKLRKQQRQQAD